MGELHLEVLVERMRRSSGRCQRRPAQVAYRETVRKRVE